MVERNNITLLSIMNCNSPKFKSICMQDEALIQCILQKDKDTCGFQVRKI